MGSSRAAVIGAAAGEIEAVVAAAAAGEVEALIAEARLRARLRRRRLTMVVLGLAVAAATGVSAATGWFSAGPTAVGQQPRSPALFARSGEVTGYIEPCIGVGPLQPDPGGAVEALRGQLRLRQLSAGDWKVILPTQVVATDRIRIGQPFSFDLPPGRYVLLAHAVQGGYAFQSFLAVTISRTARLHQDIPNGCK
jgi:hypothetical protein